ncbi:MAG: T9SS type A sorting domain-containing protein [Flavobacteriales bacterium]|nr:T9SS type A sorting domain-containing protein [Flavobacteriales bacterium]
MTDATGRTVSLERVFRNGENAVDISDLADGTYILRLQIGEELRYVRITKAIGERTAHLWKGHP